jgi:PleD family two-component response regulator
MQSKSIMVVDDSSTIRKIIQRELSAADYEVILARNGMEALAMLEWADPLPDLISLDIDMPQMNGLELCAKIRAGANSDNEKKSYGYYASIWKKQTDGSWKWVLDNGISGPPEKDESDNKSNI